MRRQPCHPGVSPHPLDPDTDDDRIPDDSDAGILTAGLLGGQYVGIGPGASETFFRDGDRIQFTQSAIVLENLISKFLFSKAAEQQPADGAAKE